MTLLAALKCPSCGGALRSEDLDEARGVAKCSYCRALLNLPSSASSLPKERPRSQVPLPPRIAVDEILGGIEIRRRWFTPALIFLVFFCIAWDGFLFFWYTVAIKDGAPWIMTVFPIVHVAVGVGLTYSTLAGLMNTTLVRVESGRLSVSHRPLPWPGNRSVDTDDIAQLYCKERIHRGRHGSRMTYEVWMSSKEGRSSKLIAAGSDCDEALYLEQRLEQALELKDQAVAGELRR